MNEEELRKLMQSGFEKLRPHIEGMTAGNDGMLSAGIQGLLEGFDRKGFLSNNPIKTLTIMRFRAP